MVHIRNYVTAEVYEASGSVINGVEASKRGYRASSRGSEFEHAAVFVTLFSSEKKG